MRGDTGGPCFGKERKCPRTQQATGKARCCQNAPRMKVGQWCREVGDGRQHSTHADDSVFVAMPEKSLG